MNGTCNSCSASWRRGGRSTKRWPAQQALGFAEADPAVDVDGGDAADKLSLIIRAAFGVAIPPGAIARDSLRLITPAQAQAALARGERLKAGRPLPAPAGRFVRRVPDRGPAD
jgi:homoserine dehydrogenase